MKKVFVLAMATFFCSVVGFGSVSFELQGSYFSPTDSSFKSIYGGGLEFGGIFSFHLTKSLDLWLDGRYFAKSGNLSYTLEETKLTLIPLGAGLSYRILPGNISPYVGAGARYIVYRETNVLGEVNSGGIGFVGKVGTAIFLSNRFGFDIHASYSYCSMQPEDFRFNVGGLEFGAGLVVSF
jgi:hypothetical protein